MKTSDKFCIIYTTTNNMESAKAISYSLVEKRLAACCSIIPGITSVYQWNDKVNEDSEIFIMIKSRYELIENIRKEIISQHPYDVPEIISVEINNGSEKYLEWVKESTHYK